MTHESVHKLLNAVAKGETSVNEAAKILETLPFTDLEFALIDNHRALRQGYPEVIYCEGKQVDQIVKIVEHMKSRGGDILATRASAEVYSTLKEVFPEAEYNAQARIITLYENPMQKKEQIDNQDEYIAIVAAGTSDYPAVEEAYETLYAFGLRAVKIVDVGVAGIHRIFAKLDAIRGAKVVIAVAGMEGALASVVGGLVDAPVIAVPTSVGYGSNFGGLSALLTMLNSCSSGVTVVNIDNGFGAAFAAAKIMRSTQG